MLDHADPRPDAARDRILRSAMDGRLLESLSYLVDRAEETLRASFDGARSQLERAHDETARGGRASPVAFALHTALVDAMKTGNAGKAQTMLDLLPDVSLTANGRLQVFDVMEAPTTLGEEGADLLLETFRSQCTQTYGSEPDVRGPGGGRADAMRAVVDKTMRALDDVDPETRAEFDVLVSHVMLLESEDVIAGSSFRTFGLIWLAALGEERSWTAYLDNLVHEAAHHHLFGLWTIDPIIVGDGDRLYRSPLRREPRPMSGIYHAMFVLARTIRTLNLLKCSPSYTDEARRIDSSYNQARNSATFEEKFFDAYTTVMENASLTDLGRRLAEGCREIVEA